MKRILRFESNSICRSPDSTPAFMTSWNFISPTDSIYHNFHIKNNYFFETFQPSPIDFRPPQPSPSPSAPDQTPSPQRIRMTRPDIPSPSGVKQDHQPHQQDTRSVDLKFIPARLPDIENIPY